MSSEDETKTDETIIDKVMAFWAEDSKIDRHNASAESAKIPQLHYKYLNLYKQAQVNLIKLRKRKKELYLDKNIFYSGKASDEEYRKANFHLKVMKGDMDTYIDADPKYANVISKIEEYEALVDILKSILAMIKDRQWQVRNIIEHDKFTSGG